MNKGGDTMSCKPIIGKTTEIKLLVKLASIKYVSYCETRIASSTDRQNGKVKNTQLHNTENNKKRNLSWTFWSVLAVMI